MKEYKKILTAILAILLTSSLTLLVLSNTTETTVKATVPSNMLQYEWKQPRSNAEGTCFAEGPAPDSPNIKWKAKVPGAMRYLVAFNGLVFASTPTATYALDGGTGEIIWTNSISSTSMGKIDDTYMMIGSTCVLIADGSVVWQGPPGFAYDQSVINGLGYVPELKMFANYNTGWNLPDPSQPPTLAWDRTLEYNVGHGYIAAYGEGTMFVGSEDGFMRGIDVKTGNVLWETPVTTTSQIYGGAYIDGKIIHGGLDNTMRAFDAETGQELWTYNPGTWYGQWASDAGAAYGMIYEHNQDTYVYAIDAETGELVWRQKGPGIGYSNTLSIADGKVYVQMGERQYRDFNTGEWACSEFNCYDAYTGELIWTLPLENGAPFNSQCIAYGNLYVIPRDPSPQEGGVWTYQTGASMGEVWCISSEVPDWSMFMNDPEHSAEGAGPTNLALKWKFKAGAQIVSQPTLVDGVCYFGSLDGKIYAVDSETGAEIWNYQTDYQVASSVAVVDDKLFTGADDGNVYCLDANTGAKIWETFAGGVTKNLLGAGTYLCIAPPVRSSPMVIGSRVYVGSLDGNLYCLNADNGNVIWKFETQGPILATPTIVDNKIYFPSCTGGFPVYYETPSPNGDFYCLDATTGSVLWQKEIPYVLNRTIFHGNHIHASPTVAEGKVFVSNGFYYNYALDANTGETIWTRTQRFNPGTGTQIGGVIQMNAPLYKYGRLYMNDYYGVTCLNATDGSEIWYAWLSRENLAQGLTYSYQRIYTVNEIGVLYVLDTLTGAKISYYEFGTFQMHGAPTPYNGNLYMGMNDWNLYCFGEARLISSEPAPSTSLSSQQIICNPIEVTETSLIITEVTVIAAVATACAIGIVSFRALRKRK